MSSENSRISETKMIIEPHRPKMQEKLFFLLSGVIVSVPLTLYAQSLASSLGSVSSIFESAAFSAVILAPFVEEFAKAFPLVYRHGETVRSIFTLGFLVGLGFGISELVIYTLVLHAFVPVRLLAVFFHASSTSITVYGIATKRPLPFYLIAVFLHFSNNFLATFASDIWFLFGPLIAIFTYFLAWTLHNRTTERFTQT